jgi:hypothetical protein
MTTHKKKTYGKSTSKAIEKIINNAKYGKHAFSTIILFLTPSEHSYIEKLSKNSPWIKGEDYLTHKIVSEKLRAARK